MARSPHRGVVLLGPQGRAVTLGLPGWAPGSALRGGFPGSRASAPRPQRAHTACDSACDSAGASVDTSFHIPHPALWNHLGTALSPDPQGQLRGRKLPPELSHPRLQPVAVDSEVWRDQPDVWHPTFLPWACDDFGVTGQGEGQKVLLEMLPGHSWDGTCVPYPWGPWSWGWEGKGLGHQKSAQEWVDTPILLGD